VVVIHGADYNHNGVYDNGLDRSDLERSLPGELTTPALCGRLVPGKDGSASRRRTAQAARLYTASLARDRSAGAGLGPTAWLCDLGETTKSA
jgi:hypothetical protein